MSVTKCDSQWTIPSLVEPNGLQLETYKYKKKEVMLIADNVGHPMCLLRDDC